jgi:hypothetical protein
MNARRITSIANVVLKTPVGKIHCEDRPRERGTGFVGLGCTLTVMPPNARSFHRHHVIDEMFYIVEGQVCRIGDESFPVARRLSQRRRAPATRSSILLIANFAISFFTLARSILSMPDSGRWPLLPDPQRRLLNGDLQNDRTRALPAILMARLEEGPGT